MLLGARSVLIVPLQYKFNPTSPRDADTANALCLVACSVPAVCELPVSRCEREFAPSDCDIKINTIPRGWCLFLSRRTRGGEPTSATFLLENGVRMPHPKIEELALQAQGVGILAARRASLYPVALCGWCFLFFAWN